MAEVPSDHVLHPRRALVVLCLVRHARLVVLLVLVALATLGCFVAASHLGNNWVRAKLNEDAAREGLATGFAVGAEARLLTDLERIRTQGMIPPRGDQHDAAPILNALVRADGDIDGVTPAWWARSDGFSALEDVKRDWLEHPEITETYELGFLKDWRALDHWNWDTADPYAAHRRRHPDQCGPESPIPNLVAFQYLARVRLAQGVHRGELAEALADTDAMVRLAFSTDTLVGEMVALSLLGREGQAIEAAGAGSGKPPGRAWTESDRLAAKAALMAVPAVFYANPGGAVAQTLIAQSEALPGVCAGLAEVLTVGSLFRGLGEPAWPGEPDLPSDLRTLDESQARSACRLTSAREFWSRPNRNCLVSLGADSWADRALGLAVRTPYLRGPVLTFLWGASTPATNFLGPYGSAS